MKLLSFTLLPILLLASTTHAQDQLMVYGGSFDFSQQDDEAALLGVEYRFTSIYRGLRPVAGIFGTSDSSVYGYGGLQWDIYLTDHFLIAPQLAAGGYSKGGGKDLWHGMEFRSQLELGYEFHDKTRLSLAVSHISNASLGDDNPGTETLTLGYSLPMNWF